MPIWSWFRVYFKKIYFKQSIKVQSPAARLYVLLIASPKCVTKVLIVLLSCPALRNQWLRNMTCRLVSVCQLTSSLQAFQVISLIQKVVNIMKRDLLVVLCLMINPLVIFLCSSSLTESWWNYYWKRFVWKSARGNCVKILHYQTDNGICSSWNCSILSQTLYFSDVGVYHQNLVCDLAIQTISSLVHNMLLHAFLGCRDN